MRLRWILSVAGSANLLIAPGNHDIGTMHSMSAARLKLFEDTFGPANRLLCYKNVSFVTFNTQVMGPHSPVRLKEQTVGFISSQATRDAVTACSGQQRPIVIQHMPLYRPNDAACGDGRDACAPLPLPGLEAQPPRASETADGAAAPWRGSSPGYCRRMSGGTTFKGRLEGLVPWHDDVMDSPATATVLAALQPAYVFSAHMHAPCRCDAHVQVRCVVAVVGGLLVAITSRTPCCAGRQDGVGRRIRVAGRQDAAHLRPMARHCNR